MSTVYSDGTVSLSTGSNIVTGTGTQFVTIADIQVGDLFTLDGSTFYEIVTVTSDTQISIVTIPNGTVYSGGNVSGASYAVIRNFTNTTTATLAVKLAAIQEKWHQREENITGWFASNAATFNVTDVYGNLSALVTPAEITRVANQATTASADFAVIESRITTAEADLDGITPSLTQFYTDKAAFDSTVATAYTDFDAKALAAANSATAASTSESNAAASATSAATSLTSVQNIFDQYDDRYLGAKASDPTVDNDGNTLLVGATYWNSTNNEMRAWNGSAWESPEAAASTSASNAAASASAAATSESNAASSASSASTSATSSANSASASASSATSSANSATAAATSETNAASSASAAATSESNAATSETNAQSWYNQAQSAVDTVGAVNKTMNFLSFTIDANGDLIASYNGVQDSSAFNINASGELEVTI